MKSLRELWQERRKRLRATERLLADVERNTDALEATVREKLSELKDEDVVTGEHPLFVPDGKEPPP